MGETREFNPQEFSVIIGGKNHEVGGFTPGTFVNITFDADSFNDEVGADGEGMRVATNNHAADIVITLQQGSPSNDILSILSSTDRATGKASFPLTIKDNFGTTINSSLQTWIKKLPDQSFADTPQPRAWTLRTLQLNSFVGGNRLL